MASVLIIGDLSVVRVWMDALASYGHTVEHSAGGLEFQERFDGDPVDIFIVEIANADWGEAMLIPQARAKWPDCKVIAVAANYGFRSSAVFQMGLWSPDQLVLKPVNLRVLTANVAFLWAQIRTTRIRRALPTMLRNDFSAQPAMSLSEDGRIGPERRRLS